MARASKGGAEPQDKREPNGASAPAGYSSDSADMSAPWWVTEEGAICNGRLIGAYDMPDQFNKGGRRDYVQVELLAPTTVKQPGKGNKPFQADKGTLVSVGITARLQHILDKYIPLVEAGAEIHLWLHVTSDRIETKSGNRVWPIDTKKRIVKPPTQQVIPRPPRSSAPAGGRGGPRPADDDVPY